MQLHFNCNSEEETVRIGMKLGKILKTGDIVTLTGDLGAGKTHFTSGIGKSLGIKEYVTSPTFTIVNEYYGEQNLYHFDLYRIENEEQLFDTGFWEYVDGEGITVIEWPEVALNGLSKNKNRVIYNVKILRRDDISPTSREIFIDGNGRLDEFENTVD